MGHRKSTRSRLCLAAAALVAAILCSTRADALPRASWEDLDAPEARVYGSEKEAKYPINAFFFEREKWESHSSFHIFWLIRGTDYPRYESSAFLPFYYHLKSKVDNRERSIYFPLLLRQIDGEERITLTPVSLFTEDASVWWNFYGWLFVRYGSKDSTSSGTALFPFVFHDSTAEKSTLTVPALLRYERTHQDTTVITPLFYSNTGSASSFTISPAHLYSRTGETKSYIGFPALPFLFFHSRDEEGTHWNALTLFDWGTDTQGSSRFFAIPFFFKGKDYLLIPPAYFDFSDSEETLRFGPGFYWHTTSDSQERIVGPFLWSTSGKDEQRNSTFHIVPLLYNNWQPESTVSFSLLHSYLRRQEEEGEVTTWGLPLLPILTYHSRSGNAVHRNFLTIFDIAWENDQLDRFWAVPFLFKGRDYLIVAPAFFDLSAGEETTRFGPVYYWHTLGERRERLVGPVWWSGDEDSSSFHIFPFLYNNFEKEERLSFSPFHFYAADSAETSWGAPLLPFLTYHSNDGETVRRNFFTLIDVEWQQDSLSRFWAVPFAFYGRTGPRAYAHILPVYFSFWGETDSFSISPLHFHSKDENDLMTGFPVLPFLAYYSREGGEVHRNFLTLFDLFWRNDQLERLWALPFVFKGPDYFALAPAYFDFSDEDETLRFGPGYYYNRTKEATRSYTPLHMYASEGEGEIASSSWGLPVLPFLTYHSRQGKETHRNFLTLFDLHWTDNTLDRIWAFPIFLKGPDYLHVTPVYFSWAEKGADMAGTNRQINPLFVKWQDRESMSEDLAFQDLFWAPILPLYFSRETEDSSLSVVGPVVWRTGEHRTLNSVWAIPFVFWHGGKQSAYLAVPPVYFRRGAWDAEEGRSFGLFHYHSWSPRHDTMWALLYYHSYERTATEVLFPFYWSWDTGASSGDVLLPLRVNYTDGTKAIHINITGFSKSMEAGVVGTSVGEKEGRWYLDTEFSWLYDAFSTSIRVSTPAVSDAKKKVEPTLDLFARPEFEDLSQRSQKDEEKSAQPQLQKSVLLSRADAYNYWSLRILYGLVAYQHADTRRHFRVLPFYWLSWDERSDDKVYFVPGMFLSYHTEETEYFAIIPAFIPVYGKQRQGKSFVESYGAILALREHNEEEKRDELSVLWPLANFYETPERSGSRIIPFYWHRSQRDSEGEKSTSVSLAFYSRTEQRNGSRNSLFLAPIVPLYFQSTSEMDGAKSLWRSVLPLFLYHSTPEKSEIYALPGLYAEFRKDSSYWNVLFGLYTKTREKDLQATSALFSLFRSASEGNEQITRLIPVYYSAAAPIESPCEGEQASTFILPVYVKRIMCKTDPASERLTILSPVFARWKRSTADAWFVTLPFLYRRDQAGEPSLTNAMGLSYWHTDERGLRDFTLFPVFHWASQRSFSGCDGNGSTVYLPLIYYRYAPCTDVAQSEFTVLSILYTRWKSEERTRWFWTVPFVFRSSEGEESFTNFMFLSYWHSKEGSIADFTVLPVFHWSKDLFVSPVYARWKDGDQSKTLVTLPFVYHSSAESESLTNFMVLSYWHRDLEGLKDVTIFPLLHWSAHRAFGDCEGKGSKTFSPLHYYRSSSCADREELTVVSPLFTRWQEEGSTRWFTTIPFIYHRSEEGSSFTNFMGLSYWRRDQEGLKDMTVLPVFHVSNGPLNTLYLFPFYRSQDEYETYFHVMPFIWSVSRDKEWTAFAAGLYLRSSESYSRQNFLYLLDHENFSGRHSLEIALGAFAYSRSADYTRLRVLYGLLASGTFGEETSFNYLLSLGSYQNRPDEFHSRLLPFYYYTSSSSEKSFYTPLFLYDRSAESTRFLSLPFYYDRTESELSVLTVPFFYYNRSDEGRMFLSLPWVDIADTGSTLQLGMLGTAYYRNYNASERTDRQMALMGIAYTEVQQPERGYRARGSVWGLLWNYETEDTGFRKFSVLKILYSRTVEIDGDIRHRILGITL